MLANFFSGFRLWHFVLLSVAAIGFFLFWARTRFWLPRYAHALAIIGVVGGLWCLSNLPEDAPLIKAGPTIKLLAALMMPAIVYFFFVFYGGQEAYGRKPKTAAETADIVERFLNGKSLYPQEWNDFVECTHGDAYLDAYRKRCYELDPLVNCPDPQDARALEELRGIVHDLRRLARSP